MTMINAQPEAPAMRPMLPRPGNEGLGPRLAGQGGWDGVNDAPASTEADAVFPSALAPTLPSKAQMSS